MWCRVELLSTADASIDHLDGDNSNNDPSNLTPSCRWCNRVRQDYWVRGDTWTPATVLVLAQARFDAWLVERGTSLIAAVARVEAQRFLELPMDAGRELAAEWHATRIASERARLARYSVARAARRKEAREERAAIQGADAAQEVSFP